MEHGLEFCRMQNSTQKCTKVHVEKPGSLFTVKFQWKIKLSSALAIPNQQLQMHWLYTVSIIRGVVEIATEAVSTVLTIAGFEMPMKRRSFVGLARSVTKAKERGKMSKEWCDMIWSPLLCIRLGFPIQAQRQKRHQIWTFSKVKHSTINSLSSRCYQYCMVSTGPKTPASPEGFSPMNEWMNRMNESINQNENQSLFS